MLNYHYLQVNQKDMAWLLVSKRVTHLTTFETVVKNYPTVYTVIHEMSDTTISLALLCRNGICIEPEKWTQQNKPLIAAEYDYHVIRILEQSNTNSNTYNLNRLPGSSEEFLVNSDKYLLVDVVVESERTLDENDLEMWKTIISKGQVHIVIYRRCV